MSRSKNFSRNWTKEIESIDATIDRLMGNEKGEEEAPSAECPIYVSGRSIKRKKHSASSENN